MSKIMILSYKYGKPGVLPATSGKLTSGTAALVHCG